MNRLIVVCSEKSQSDLLAFKLGIPTSSIFPVSDEGQVNQIPVTAKGGLITFLKPYPPNILKLKSSIFGHPISKNLIQLEFTDEGDCNELRELGIEINRIGSYYRQSLEMSPQQAHSDLLKGLSDQVDRCLVSSGLTREKGFEFSVKLNSAGNSVLIPITPSSSLISLLLRKYGIK